MAAAGKQNCGPCDSLDATSTTVPLARGRRDAPTGASKPTRGPLEEEDYLDNCCGYPHCCDRLLYSARCTYGRWGDRCLFRVW